MIAYYDPILDVLTVSSLIMLVLAPIIYFKITRKFDRYVYISIPMPIVVEQIARNHVYTLWIAFNKKKYHDYGGRLLGEYDFRGNATLFDLIISILNTGNNVVFFVSIALLVYIDLF
jgi:hypothetical protein